MSNVEEMNWMFKQAWSFNQPLNNWNVSKVTNMEYMFFETDFNQPLNNWPLNNWDVSNLISDTCLQAQPRSISRSTPPGTNKLFHHKRFYEYVSHFFPFICTFQLLSGWLKDSAIINIPNISVTLETFQLLRDWLKEYAELNIHSI